MSEFEDQLRNALTRKQPPADFAARVITRLPARQRPWTAWAAAIAALLVMTVGAVRYNEYRRGMEAKQQLLRALAITEEKFALVEHKLKQRGEQ